MTPHPFLPKLEHAFTISIELAGLQWVKPTSQGATRAAVYAASGKVEGPRLNGRVVPMSGGDFPPGAAQWSHRFRCPLSAGGGRWCHHLHAESRLPLGTRGGEGEEVA